MTQTLPKALFKALSLEAKIFFIGFGGIPILVGSLGTLYSFCSQLFPTQLPSSNKEDAFPFFALYGLIMTIGCGILGAFRLHKQRRRKRLVRVGQRIDLPITKIELSPIKEKTRRRYYICSNWQDPITGKKFTFESEILYFDPSKYVRQGDTLPIYFQPGNPADYYFDVKDIKSGSRFRGISDSGQTNCTINSGNSD